MTLHSSSVAKTYFFHLRRIRKVKLCLQETVIFRLIATLPYSVYLHGRNNLYPQLYTMLLVYIINGLDPLVTSATITLASHPHMYPVIIYPRVSYPLSNLFLI